MLIAVKDPTVCIDRSHYAKRRNKARHLYAEIKWTDKWSPSARESAKSG